MDELITVEQQDDVCLIGLNDPGRGNPISLPLIEQLHAALTGSVTLEPQSLVIWGHGDSFSSGADMDAYRSTLEDVARHQARQFYDSERLLLDIARILRRPNVLSIAAVHGWVVGVGLELSASCDFIVASDDAKFWLPETAVGWNSGMGLTQRLVRTVGMGWARRMMLLGDQLPAARAEELGLVARVTAREDAVAEATRLVRKFRSAAPLAAQYQKRLLDLLPGMALDDSIEIEIITGHWLAHTRDVSEAAAAFTEKRAPKFLGE